MDNHSAESLSFEIHLQLREVIDCINASRPNPYTTSDKGPLSIKSSGRTMATVPPFHRLLAFFSNRNQHDTQTIRLQDSLRGNLALGLDFPVALGIAFGRHLWLKNTGFFSLNIHVPSVRWRETPLHGIKVDEKKEYTCSELMGLVRKEKGVMASLDAMGVWALAADVRTGLIRGEEVIGFQEGWLLGAVEKKRRGREQILPLWRGGPISVSGHSWVVDKLFGVKVYEVDDSKGD